MTAPEPLTPADCDLRGLEYMPLLGQRLFGSEFDALASDSEWRAGLTLWWAAWTQCPAASLPDDDIALCRLADLGRDLKTWRKLKARALHGFVKCSDGRLYHPTLAQQALVAWEKRVKERERKAQWRAKKQGQDADVPRDGDGKERGQGQGQDADVPADGTRRDGTVVIPFSNENGSVPDPGKTLFDVGVSAIMAQGVSQSSARSFLAKCQRERGDASALEALNASIGATDIRSRMTAILGGKRASSFEFAGGPC